jgi:capsular polysaccharide export protein
LHRRVVVLGEACYGINGLSKPVVSPASLLSVINNLSSWTTDVELTERFLAYLKHEYCVPVSWRNPDAVHFKSLEKKFAEILSDVDRA